MKHYSQAVKHHVVTEIEAGHLSVAEAQRRFGIQSAETVYRWLRAFGKSTRTATRLYVTMKDEQDPLAQRDQQIRKLKADKQALESALAQKDLKLLMAESFITVAERHFGCEEGFIKKNFVPELSIRPEPPVRGSKP
jgi:transposase-like protein